MKNKNKIIVVLFWCILLSQIQTSKGFENQLELDNYFKDNLYEEFDVLESPNIVTNVITNIEETFIVKLVSSQSINGGYYIYKYYVNMSLNYTFSIEYPAFNTIANVFGGVDHIENEESYVQYISKPIILSNYDDYYWRSIQTEFHMNSGQIEPLLVYYVFDNINEELDDEFKLFNDKDESTIEYLEFNENAISNTGFYSIDRDYTIWYLSENDLYSSSPLNLTLIIGIVTVIILITITILKIRKR